jgi:hypothetical protein
MSKELVFKLVVSESGKKSYSAKRLWLWPVMMKLGPHNSELRL